MENSFSPKIWKKQDTILIKLTYNDLDSQSSEHYRDMVEKVVEAYPCNCIIIDFASVVLVDSEGVAAIMFSYHACAAKEIRLLACSIRPNVFEMLAKKGVTSLVEVFPNVHAALDAATEYTSLNQSRQQKAQSMESIFGDPAEESIQYNNS